MRQEYRDTGEPFSLAAFHQRVYERCADLKDGALDGLVALATNTADREGTRERAEGQWLYGMDMEGDYKLPDKMRIAKEHARREHILASLEFGRANRDMVNAAQERREEEFRRLDPYLGPGVRKREAVEMYVRDHPDAEAEAEA